MSLGGDLAAQAESIFGENWSTRDGQKVPSSEDLKLSNDAVKLEGAVLYADLTASTKLVDGFKDWFAAEVYKAYLYCAARVIRSEGGEITSYDGDRIMAVFIGESKETAAARAGFKINYVTKRIVNPALKEKFGAKTDYQIQQTVGIDTSSLFVARTGIRGSNDLVWVGRAANHAAKLTALSPAYPTRVTADVHARLDEKMRTSSGKNVWSSANWTDMGQKIYRSTWWWEVK
jgi:class 3 adenylate cyclase